jgi:hypothetical protein
LERIVFVRLAHVIGRPDPESLTWELLSGSLAGAPELTGLVPHVGRDLPERWARLCRRLPVDPERVREALIRWAEPHERSAWDQERLIDTQRFAHALLRSGDPFYRRVGEALLDALREEVRSPRAGTAMPPG